MQQRIIERGGLVQPRVTRTTTHIIALPTDPLQTLQEALRSTSSDRPTPIHIVSQNFIAQSILANHKQQEALFRPPIVDLLAPPPVPSSRPTPTTPGPTTASIPTQIPLYHHTSQPRPLPTPSKRKIEQEEEEEEELNATPQTKIARSPRRIDAFSPFSNPAHPLASQQQRETWTSEDIATALIERKKDEWYLVRSDRQKPKFTGGNTGIPWGFCGVFTEPYDTEEAAKTVDILRHFWYLNEERKTTVNSAQSDYSTDTTKHDDNDDNNDKRCSSRNSEKEENGVCRHVACARRTFCIIERLGEVKATYVPGRDQFQLKALERAQQKLARLPTPLDTEEDVERVEGLGEKSSRKVKEILYTGHSSRVAVASKNERLVAYNELLKIWGVGVTVAERWYRLYNFRTVQQVREFMGAHPEEESTLTEQQRVGLKYVDDFLQPIRREEVAAVETAVRAATFDLVEEIAGTAHGYDKQQVDRTYCFATGSYQRGKLTSSDVDMLIVLPPPLVDHDCEDFLRNLLGRLMGGAGTHGGVRIEDELRPNERRQHAQRGRVSWMGVYSYTQVDPTSLSPSPSSYNTRRRIDFKLYSWDHVVCAVNYFSNSQSFCRATRHFAGTGVGAGVAQRYAPNATGFKLSDVEMRPRGSRHGSDGDDALVGPAIPLRNETELFQVLGLAYVPPTMRYFNDAEYS